MFDQKDPEIGFLRLQVFLKNGNCVLTFFLHTFVKNRGHIYNLNFLYTSRISFFYFCPKSPLNRLFCFQVLLKSGNCVLTFFQYNFVKNGGYIYNLNFLCKTRISFRFLDCCPKSPSNKLLQVLEFFPKYLKKYISWSFWTKIKKRKLILYVHTKLKL